jgi:antirestriction protein ArdC
VKKGAQDFPVVFWKFRDLKKQEDEADEDREDGQKQNVPILRYYTVFRMEDIEGIPEKKLPEIMQVPDAQPIEKAERIVENMPNQPAISGSQKPLQACIRQIQASGKYSLFASQLITLLLV